MHIVSWMKVDSTGQYVGATLDNLARRFFGKVIEEFEWKWPSGTFTFRGCELAQKEDGIHVTMRDYASL